VIENSNERAVRDSLREAADRAHPAAGFVDRLLANARTAPPTADTVRRRHVWWFPLLAAAAVVVVAAGVTTALTVAGSRHVSPAHSVSPRPHSSAPSQAPTGSTTSTRTRTSAAPSAAACAPRVGLAACPRTELKLLRVPFGNRAVTVSVPSGWRLSPSQPQRCCNIPRTVCLVSGRSEYAGNPNNCVLTITLVSALTPDVPRPDFPDNCAQPRTTTDESDAPIQGRPAEYRRFVDPCTGVTSELWATMSAPQVVFWHPITQQSSPTVAAAAVASARLPVVTDGRRQFDEGYVTGMSLVAGHYRITINRVVESADGTIIDHNPATYSYALDGYVAMGGGVRPCATYPNCDLASLFAQYRRGPHPSTGTPVDGAYVQIAQDGHGYQLGFIRCPTRAC
jgi:hypothetical protein